jgi:8-oxo-dGTP diphosphatase
MRLFHDEFLVSTAGIFFDKHNRVLLFEHIFRNGKSWGIPSGYINSKEHPKEALEREVKEESGFIVSVDRRFKIRTDRNSARLEILYIGEFIGGDFEKSREVTDAKLFEIDQLPDISDDIKHFIYKAHGLQRRTG